MSHHWPVERQFVVAKQVLALWLTRADWVHRRVDTLEFIDERRVRLHASVDFTVPDWPYEGSEDSLGEASVILPVGLFRKGVLRKFDIYDEHQTALPVLTRVESQAIARQILISLAERALANKRLGNLGSALADELGAISASLTPDEGRQLLNNAAPLSDPGAFEADPIRECIFSDPDLAAFVADLAENYLLYVLVKARPGDRKIIKFDLEQGHPRFGLATRQRVAATARAIWRFVTGPGSLELTIPLPAARLANSYHVEVPAEEELFIRSAVINRIGTTGHFRDGPNTLVHLYVSEVGPDESGALVLQLNLEPSGVLTGSLFIALLTLSFLGGGLYLHDSLHLHPAGEAASALVLTVPGILAAYLFRPGEHRFVRTFMREIRLWSAMLTLASFLAAGALVVALPPQARVSVWQLLTIGTAVVSFRLLQGVAKAHWYWLRG